MEADIDVAGVLWEQELPSLQKTHHSQNQTAFANPISFPSEIQ